MSVLVFGLTEPEDGDTIWDDDGEDMGLQRSAFIYRGVNDFWD